MADAAVGERSLAISDDGSVVAYDSGSATTDNRVIVRDRVAATTLLDVVGARPALSADGCTVALSTAVDDAGVVTTTLSAYDLCADEPTQDVGTKPGTSAVAPAPALSADGSVAVWSPDGSITRYVDDGSGYVPDATFTPAVPPGHVVGVNVDVSADGAVVVFEVLPTGGTPSDSEVWLWDDSTSSATVIGGAGSHRPTVSADGALVGLESSDAGLAVGVTPAPLAPFVAVYDRDDEVAVIVADEAWRPALSSDGHHLLYRTVDDLRIARWSEGAPFESIGDRSVGRTLVADDSAPPEAPLATLSAHARWVAFDGDDGANITEDDSDDTGTHVWTSEERPAGGGADVDLGRVVGGDALDTTVTITNESAAGAALDGAVTVDSPFSVVSTSCEAPSDDVVFVLQPGASCTARVRALTSDAGTITAEVSYHVAGDPAVSLTVGLTGTVTPPPATTPPPPVSTTPVASTVVPQPTLPVGTAPTRPPVFTIPRSSGGAGSSGGFPSSGGGSNSSSTGSSGSATTTVPASSPLFDPSIFEFVPTIVEAGRRTATIVLLNTTTETISVVDVGIDPASVAASSYSVEAVACVGVSLPGGASCAVDVTFAPLETGDLASAVLASLDDGSIVRAELSGLGAEPPILTVVPGVASTGQVVSLIGAGYPAGAVVEVSWEGARESEMVEISDVGDLAHTLIVLPHTARGPSTVTVLGQDGLFGDVTAEMLVTSNSSRPVSVIMRELSPIRN